MIKLLIFDLDGTLIDSAPDIIASVRALTDERGIEPPSDTKIVGAIGEGLRQLIINLFPEFRDNAAEVTRLMTDFYDQYERNLSVQTRVFSGVEKFLGSWSEHLAIVSNKPARLAREVVAAMGLAEFPWLHIFGADSLAKRKPDPLPLLECMQTAGLTAKETVMIGDGIPDMLAARSAGTRAVGVTFGYGRPEVLVEKGAEVLINSFDQLPGVLADFDRRG